MFQLPKPFPPHSSITALLGTIFHPFLSATPSHFPSFKSLSLANTIKYSTVKLKENAGLLNCERNELRVRILLILPQTEVTISPHTSFPFLQGK
jgi:hypothetical protein